MNSEEIKFFIELSKDRAENADSLEKPSMRGIKNSVVEKYSDQAHFIYELLQNADDAQATRARFILEPTRLIFAHNGTRQFSVSDVSREEKDSSEGKLGDINAITSIGNSNKKEASIGKFGIGFKAVFQYTTTPHIYGPNFCFKIERFIVPILLDSDFPGRKPEETLFVFPFDHPERNAEEAYSNILDKLKSLTYPLLFLSRLKNITFRYSNTIGIYGKNVEQTKEFDSTTAELVSLTQSDGDEPSEEKMWLFSRIYKDRYKYSVGFFLDNVGNLRPVTEPAFCFFPTKEVTGLNFIIHAPFLLTDSREGIRAGIVDNKIMIESLAKLAASAITYLKEIGAQESKPLISDNILKIIPYNPQIFSKTDDKRKISFLPFYNFIKKIFMQKNILPSTEGFTSSTNAYWAAVPQLTQLFSNKQLGVICEDETAHWVFPSLGRDETRNTNKELSNYIDDIVNTNLNETAIISGRSREVYYNRATHKMDTTKSIKGITAQFIEAQSLEWLHRFYKWLSETKGRTESILKKPIFLNQDKQAVAAYDMEKQLILFLPDKTVSGYTVVHPSLLRNSDTIAFIKSIGVKTPSLRDRIYNKILPQYKSGEKVDTASHFLLFFEYYCRCPYDEIDNYIELIRELEFLKYTNAKGTQPNHGTASTIYFPIPDLKAYFESKTSTRFLAYEEYRELVGASKEKDLVSFLIEIGVKSEVAITTAGIDYSTSDRHDLPNPYSTRGTTWKECVIDGCKEIVEYISIKQDKEKSILLWDTLLQVIADNCTKNEPLSKIITGKCEFFYRLPQCELFPSSDELFLKNKPWLLNCDGEFVSSKELTRTSLLANYDSSSNKANNLLDFLGIIDETSACEEDDPNLTDIQREKIKFANKLKAMGIEESDLEELQRIKRRREAENKEVTWNNDGASNQQLQKLNKTTSNVINDDIARRTKDTPSASADNKPDAENDIDQDEYMPPVVNYSSRIEQAKRRSAAEIDRIAYYEKLQEEALSATKYSFKWFKVLLEMECINSGEANSNNKEVSISFGKVERDPGTQRTLVLKRPNRYIPQFMEDLADIPMVLYFEDGTKTVAIEVSSIQSYTLRVKLKNGTDIDGIDLSSVKSVTIDAKSPAFLLERLRDQFSLLGYDDDFNMQQNLCKNIEFVFGPPGTGKTTHLAKNVLIPMMQKNDNCKVLVLTPTNKAADVLVRRVMELSGSDLSYEDWLIRYGITGDEEIEQSPVFKERYSDILKYPKSVVVTTIARFPYDYFYSNGEQVHLYGVKWDYIIIDEASMIPIANIVYPFYKKTPQKFIVAGDPFQIEPITSVDFWKNENIYTLVTLNSFTNPQTIPHPYKVELLTKQFRSIPEIGNIFSSFAYGGILEHNRTSASQRPLNIKDDPDIRALNIIKFPVSKYESIYRSKRLQHSSSYQIYSALFTYEYICYLSREIAKSNPGTLFRIGVIAPYRAQADLIDKLMSSEDLPNEVDVQVGTIHGFQGDECDIIFSVFNTPPKISSNKDMFLNKLNIINVSISRARDYLFIVMPDDDTENISNLELVKEVERLIKNSSNWTETLTPDLEAQMFDDPNYLENNAFSTSHQSVNVYGLPEKYYEVRTEENAVDIQIHKGLKEISPNNYTYQK